MFSIRSIRRQGTLGEAVRVLAVAAGAAMLLAGCDGSHGTKSSHAAPVAAAGAPTATVSSADRTAEVAALLQQARRAYAERKVLAPAGDNAMEYYEAALAKDPANAVARDALREIFPYGVPYVEAAIARHDTDEAGREIDVLAKADPDNHTVALLRSMLGSSAGQPQSSVASDGSPAAFDAGKRSLVLKASADSWVEVASVDGRRVDSRVLRAGEARSYRSNGALRVTLGNAAAVAVVADGKPLAVTSARHSRVARLVVFAPAAASDRVAAAATDAGGRVAM